MKCHLSLKIVCAYSILHGSDGYKHNSVIHIKRTQLAICLIESVQQKFKQISAASLMVEMDICNNINLLQSKWHASERTLISSSFTGNQSMLSAWYGSDVFGIMLQTSLDSWSCCQGLLPFSGNQTLADKTVTKAKHFPLCLHYSTCWSEKGRHVIDDLQRRASAWIVLWLQMTHQNVLLLLLVCIM